MEGISGIVYWPRPQLGGRDARDDWRQRQAMAGDVNAVVEGARRGGGKDIYVIDFHGSSPARPNLMLEDLDPEVMVYSGHGHMGMLKPLINPSYDAFMLVGMHALDGVPDGVLSHNFTSSYKEIYVNGLRIGELGYFALFAGAHGVPLVLVTGDEATCREARELIGKVETVPTKEGIAHGFALLYPLSSVREALIAGAEKAMQRLSEFEPYRMEGPYRVEIVMGGGNETRKADACALFPFVERLGGSRIGYTCSYLKEALANLRALHVMSETQRER